MEHASIKPAMPEHSACWGAELNGGVRCPPDFVPGKLHFKNNFCDNCRDGIMVPLAHVCALSAEQAACFVNKRSKGFWNHAPPANMGGGQYRIVNNTAGCIGPWLAVFREEPPHLAWPVTPEGWATDDGYMHLCVAKGTLVPVKSLRCGSQASAKRRKMESNGMLDMLVQPAAGITDPHAQVQLLMAPPRTVAYAAPAAIAPASLAVSAGAQISYQNMVQGGPQTQELQTQELQTQELQTKELQTQELQTKELQTQELQGTMRERSLQEQRPHSPHD